MKVAVAKEVQGLMVLVGVEARTVCQQVSPIRVACNFNLHIFPTGESGDRPIWCTQHLLAL